MRVRLLVLSFSSLLLLACPEDPKSGVLVGAVECTSSLDRVEIRGTASGALGERLSLSKSGTGADKLRVDVANCDEWVYDNDVPGLVDCIRQGNAASTALWSVTYAVTTGSTLSAEPVIWNAAIKSDNDVVSEHSEARIVTLASNGGCVVTF